MALLCENLKALRKEQDWKQTELAKLLNSKQQTVASWERGESKPSASTLVELAKLYNVSVDWLLGLSEYRTMKDYEEKLAQDNPTSIPEKLTYGYILDFIFRLKDVDYIEPFTGYSDDNRDINQPHKLYFRDPFIVCLLNLIYSKSSYSPDVEYPRLMQEIKEKFADKEILHNNYQKMQDYYCNDVHYEYNALLNLNLDDFYNKLKKISAEMASDDSESDECKSE